MAREKKVWFITGVSRGLGKSLAEAALANDDIVIGTSRSGEAEIIHSTGTLHLLPLDVSLREQVREAVSRAQTLHGRLDVIVNNAGYGLLGAIETTSTAEAYDQLDTNFMGTMFVIQHALPFLRAQGHGHIINLSSIAGLAPVGGYGLYAASKFAVEGLSVSLAHEVRHFGINVTVVEPGAFRTDFLSENSIRHTAKNISAYADSSGETINRLRQYDGKQIGDPDLAARAIIEVVESPEPPLHLVLGSDAFERATKMLTEFSAELSRWQAVSLSTDYQMTAAK
ncbi:MAG: SDR family NAD(P)-dependent oxidoreductase [Cyanobacteria bacterium REEB67]|nr:SDR family NAD(P)-dependent oxidoreductase [Cyanobacteria bacterium REEB67]